MLTRLPEGDRNAGMVKQLSIDATKYVEFEYSSNGRVSKSDVYERVFPNSPLGAATDRKIDSIEDQKIDAKKDPGKTAYYQSLDSVDNCLSRLNSMFTKKATFKEGDKVKCSSDLGTYTVAKEQKEISGPNCVDFMDPGDCSLLFNACDPVICPPSRCNLGGNWQVDNVVETGIIGSSVLCMNNFPEVKMPVCITGISAGLQNINSILSGYKQCLETQKIKGQSVGICDRIRNIYICDMLWREGLAIFNVKGGLISLITEKLFAAAEGSEYSSFKENFDNSINSAKYFTQNYAKNVFAAYKGGR